MLMFHVRYEHHLHTKSKAFPVTGLVGAYGCETWGLPHILDKWLTLGRELVKLMRRPRFRREDSCYKFLFLFLFIGLERN
jgi:hypothetical protein